MKCSFCNKDQTEVEKIIAASDKIGICDECIMQCLDILVYGEPEPIQIVLDDDISEEDSDAQKDSGC